MAGQIRLWDSGLLGQEPPGNHQRKGIESQMGYSLFCRWQIWFQWRPGSRCWKIHPGGQSRPHTSPKCTEGRTTSDHHSLCEWLRGAANTAPESDCEQRDILSKKCNYLRKQSVPAYVNCATQRLPAHHRAVKATQSHGGPSTSKKAFPLPPLGPPWAPGLGAERKV